MIGDGKQIRNHNFHRSAKQEAKVARLTAVIADDARARAEDDLTPVQDALAVMKEDKGGLAAEVVLLTVERTSLLLALEASKDEVSFLHSQVMSLKLIYF